jgi:hypothetical protein
VDGAEALPLIESVMNSRDEALRDAAILALGGSRRADAIEILKNRFARSTDPALKKCILLALASSRTEEAMDWLIGLVKTGSETEAAAAEEALSLHRGDARMDDRIAAARAERSD